MLAGYCRGCGQVLGPITGVDRLCGHCRADRVGRPLAGFPTRAETDLLAAIDFESVLRLRRLRRRVRAGHIAG